MFTLFETLGPSTMLMSKFPQMANLLHSYILYGGSILPVDFNIYHYKLKAVVLKSFYDKIFSIGQKRKCLSQPSHSNPMVCLFRGSRFQEFLKPFFGIWILEINGIECSHSSIWNAKNINVFINDTKRNFVFKVWQGRQVKTKQ